MLSALAASPVVTSLVTGGSGSRLPCVIPANRVERHVEVERVVRYDHQVLIDGHGIEHQARPGVWHVSATAPRERAPVSVCGRVLHRATRDERAAGVDVCPLCWDGTDEAPHHTQGETK